MATTATFETGSTVYPNPDSGSYALIANALNKRNINNPRSTAWCPLMVAMYYHIEDALVIAQGNAAPRSNSTGYDSRPIYFKNKPWQFSAACALDIAGRATAIAGGFSDLSLGGMVGTDAGIGRITHALIQAISGFDTVDNLTYALKAASFWVTTNAPANDLSFLMGDSEV